MLRRLLCKAHQEEEEVNTSLFPSSGFSSSEEDCFSMMIHQLEDGEGLRQS